MTRNDVLTREQIEDFRMVCVAEAESRGPNGDRTLVKLCDMALAALSQPSLAQQDMVMVPRELVIALTNYAGEYENPVPDYTLRVRYRAELFRLLSALPAAAPPAEET